MKALVIGLGSMGKRRVRNLQALGVRDIYGYEQNKKTAAGAKKLYQIKILETLRNVKAHDFDLAVISTPPGHHLRFAKVCAENQIPFFVEFNLLTKESLAIKNVAEKCKVAAFSSDTELFDDDIIQLDKLLDRKFKGYFVFHLGQNIHDWHPWQKAGEHFIFHPKTNGIREMLRVELPWMLRLFGHVKKAAVQKRRFYTKAYGVDDFLSLELEFLNGNRGIIVLNLLSPKVIKRMDIVSKDRVITWHERKNEFEIFSRSGKRTSKILHKKKFLKHYQFHEDAHLSELRHVLAVIRGKERSVLDFRNELEVLKLIDLIERTGKNAVRT